MQVRPQKIPSGRVKGNAEAAIQINIDKKLNISESQSFVNTECQRVV